MLHGFLAERSAAKLPGLAGSGTPAAIEQVAILGAGTMGASIAMACANAGLRVSLSDGSTEALTRGFSTIQRSYQSSVDRGRLTAAAAAERFARIRSVSGYEGCASADLVIEAVYENMTIKKEVFGEIGRRARPGAILASNTSTLDIDQLGAVSGVPESVVGLHFFSPAHVMRLVEIVRGVATGEGVVAAALQFAKRLSKVGVVVRNAPGFVGNRIMFPYMYEAQFLVEEGASPEQVDRCSRTSAWRWASSRSTTWAGSTSRGASARSCASSRARMGASPSSPTCWSSWAVWVRRSARAGTATETIASRSRIRR